MKPGLGNWRIGDVKGAPVHHGASPYPSVACLGFELSLVLKSGEPLNSERISTANVVRANGYQIAEFLNVPLVDHMGGL